MSRGLYAFLAAAVLSLGPGPAIANTHIDVYNDYRQRVHVVIGGAGVGGCNTYLDDGESTTDGG